MESSEPLPGRTAMARQLMRNVRIHQHRVDIDHGADGVQMHGGAILTDRHDQHRTRKSQLERRTRQTLRAGGMSSFANPHRQHAVGQGQDVAALQVLLAPAVNPLSSAEARMEGVDQVGELGFAAACRHRQGRDRRHGPRSTRSSRE